MYKFITALLAVVVSLSGFAAVTVEQALQKPGRLPADIERDARSRPDVTLPLLKLKKGDLVVDIFGGGGYYSELVATMVGEEGEVLLLNNAAYKGFAAKGIAARLENRDIGSVTIYDVEAEDMDLGENELDAALLVMSYHDLYHVDEPNGWRAIDSADFLGQIYRGLKPGARFLIVDHQAAPGSGKSAAQALHRIDVEFAKQDIGSQGFKLVASSDALRNPDDNYELMVFDPAVRGKTDRFVLVFEKPAQ